MKKVSMLINPDDRKSHINKEIYGHFTEHLGRCIYNGIFVGENSDIPNTEGIRNDIIEALKDIKSPVIRWPGGCFADEYHWRDGIGDKEKRKKMINTHWGGVTEDNSFGTHEFMKLCELVGAEPYIAGNLGSGTVQELSEWIEYMTSYADSPVANLRRANGKDEPWKLKYLGIGNESWGCGGNMRPEYYVDEYRKYATYCRNYDGNELYKVACGPNADDYHWTETVMKDVKSYHAKAISLHFYTVPTGDWSHKGSATGFTDEEYYKTIETTRRMEELVTRHSNIMSVYDPQKEIGLIVDEWGCWFDVEEGTNPGFLYQQNTMRDAMVAAINLDIFNNHSDRVVMANVAQAVNVLQSVILTEGEKMILTPTYHVFKLYTGHMDNDLVYSHLPQVNDGKTDILTHSVSRNGDELYITASNVSLTEEVTVSCDVAGYDVAETKAQILTGKATDYNDFEDNMTLVKINENYKAEIKDGKIEIVLPPCSVVGVSVKLK